MFFHANDFGEHRHAIQSGLRVRYEVAEGERGLKVATVSILDQQPSPARRPAAADQYGDDDGMCDVLSARDFTAEVTEMLIEHVPSLTGTQIGQVRHHLLTLARTHGWVDA
ncbi:cold shock domain-containing protein [Thermocatellispora tengchongensis]|uniref:cold shock domain-containing protein n=1 Tax=Thermocatellispora tengchongensis TaxID=1073253 RepID=UPI0036380CFC